MSTTTAIRPGLLIALHSSVIGGVFYEREELGGDARRKEWKTTRIVSEPEEREAATKARSKALAEIRAICATSAFGLLCPEDKESELDAAIVRAQEIRAAHNAGAKVTRVEIYALKGRIASTDEEAARAIGSEVAEMIAAMNSGIDKLDPKAIREAATKAKDLAAMLAPDVAEKVGGAIEQARRAARQITARIEKGGELAAIVLADIQRGAIERARMAFLDLSGDAPAPASDPLPAVNMQRFGALAVGTEYEPMDGGVYDEPSPTPPPVSVTTTRPSLAGAFDDDLSAAAGGM